MRTVPIDITKACKFDSAKLKVVCSADGSKVKSADAQFYKNGKVYNIVKMDVYVNTHADGYGDKKTVDTGWVKIKKKPAISITVNS